MKVKLDNQRLERPAVQRGLKKLFSTPKTISYYQVDCIVEFSEEERAILTTYGLWNTIIYKDYLTFDEDYLAANPGLADAEGEVEWKIKDFADNGRHKHFSTPNEAAAFAEKLKTETLPAIQRCIKSAKETGTGTSTTFEL